MIPDHLSKLPVWRNLPVPYVNVRGRERDESEWYAAHDPVVGQLAWFAPEADVDDEPDFTKQCPQRERFCAAKGLCQVCRRLCSWPRWLVASGQTSLQTVRIEGVPNEVPVFTEPWLCKKCLRFAIETCPGLIRRRREEDLAVMRADAAQRIVATAWMDMYGPEVVAVNFVKIVVTRGRLMTTEEAMTKL